MCHREIEIPYSVAHTNTIQYNTIIQYNLYSTTIFIYETRASQLKSRSLSFICVPKRPRFTPNHFASQNKLAIGFLLNGNVYENKSRFPKPNAEQMDKCVRAHTNTHTHTQDSFAFD